MHKNSIFCVGSPKCGTTTLHAIMSKVTGVTCGDIKEPHFFFNKEVSKSYYDISPISDLESYQRNYVDGEIGIDFSPSYLRSSKAAERIKKYNGDAKIIVLVRDPIERAISHYKMDRSFGYVSCDFGEAIEQPKYYEEYIDNSLYVQHINEYESLFDKENVLVLDVKSLNSIETITTVLNFCEVSCSDVPSLLTNNKQNVAWQPKYNFVPWLMRVNTKYRLSSRLPSSIKLLARNAFTSDGGGEVGEEFISSELRQKLLDVFSDEYLLISQLSE